MPALKGEAAWPRKEFIYWTDDGSVAALRYGNWKITFLEQNAEGLQVWQEPFEELRAPLLTNLRMDPFERAEEETPWATSAGIVERMFMFAPAGAYVGAVAAELPGIPAAAEARQLQPRPRDGGDHQGHGQVIQGRTTGRRSSRLGRRRGDKKHGEAKDGHEEAAAGGAAIVWRGSYRPHDLDPVCGGRRERGMVAVRRAIPGARECAQDRSLAILLSTHRHEYWTTPR